MTTEAYIAEIRECQLLAKHLHDRVHVLIVDKMMRGMPPHGGDYLPRAREQVTRAFAALYDAERAVMKGGM